MKTRKVSESLRPSGLVPVEDVAAAWGIRDDLHDRDGSRDSFDVQEVRRDHRPEGAGSGARRAEALPESERSVESNVARLPT